MSDTTKYDCTNCGVVDSLKFSHWGETSYTFILKCDSCDQLYKHKPFTGTDPVKYEEPTNLISNEERDMAI
jgi:hypothetical protein